MRAEGIDVSKYDKGYDPAKAERAPDFVIQRASYGVVRDQAFEVLLPGVLATPVRGAYHYMSSEVPWKAQAERFLEVVAGIPYHFYAADFEAAFNILSPSFVAATVEWMRYVRSKTKKTVLIYTNPNLYNSWLARYDGPRVAAFPLWLGQYPGKHTPEVGQERDPALPLTRKDWTFWQYSPGELNALGARYGVARRGVDVNVFNGTRAELAAAFGAPVTIEGPEPPPGPALSDAEKLRRLWEAHPELHQAPPQA